MKYNIFKLVKKITLVILMIVSVQFSVTGQSIGGGTSLIFGGGSFGLHGRYEQYVTETIEGAAQFSLFLNNGSFWAIDVDGHYNLSTSDGFRLYPFGGININGGHGGNGGEEGFDNIGINLGIGAGYPFKNNIEFFGELKYTIVSYESAALTLGALIPFGGGGSK